MTEPKLKEVIVATDFQSGYEAIYVDGEKVFTGEDAYACDIAKAASGPMDFHHMVIELEPDEEFPDTTAKLFPLFSGMTSDEVADVLAESKEESK